MHVCTHTHTVEEGMPRVTKHFKITAEELKEIERHRAVTGEDFTKYTLESLRLRRSGQWKDGVNRIKALNDKKKLIDFEKKLIKKDLHKQQLAKKAKKREALEKEEVTVTKSDEELEHNMGQTLHQTMNGKWVLWYKNDDDWYGMPHNEDMSDEGYVRKSQLPPGLMKIYEKYLEQI